MIESSHIHHARRILVRAPNWVGDVMMCTPALARLRAIAPQAEIVVLARPAMATLLEGNPNLDEVMAIDDRKRAGWVETVRRVRAERFDFGLLFPNSFQSAILLRLAGLHRLRGFARDGRRFLLAEPVPFDPEFHSVHEVVNYLRLVGDRPEAHPEIRPGFPPLEFYLLDRDRAERDRRLAEMGIDPARPYLSITPGAAFGVAKRWPAERFGAVAARLAAERGLTVLVLGSASEADTVGEVCECVHRESGGAAAAHSLIEGWSLRLLAAILERTCLHLTNDSGPMHMAAALGSPLVAIFGPTDWIATAPWSSRARMLRAPTECSPCHLRDCPIDHRCMDRVTVESVLEAGRELLRESMPAPS